MTRRTLREPDALVTDHDREVTAWHESGHTLSGDIQSATELATSMATSYGMTRLGYQVRRRGSAPAQDVSDVVEELLGEAHTAATKLLGEHISFLGAVAAELLAEETLTLAEVHQIATRLGVTRHADVPSPQLPGQVRAAKPVVCMEVPSLVAGAVAEPVVADLGSSTATTRGRLLADILALLPWRRRRDEGRFVAEG